MADFCCHAHKDHYNTVGGVTAILTVTSEIVPVQLHVLHEYKLEGVFPFTRFLVLTVFFLRVKASESDFTFQAEASCSSLREQSCIRRPESRIVTRGRRRDWALCCIGIEALTNNLMEIQNDSIFAVIR